MPVPVSVCGCEPLPVRMHSKGVINKFWRTLSFGSHRHAHTSPRHLWAQLAARSRRRRLLSSNRHSMGALIGTQWTAAGDVVSVWWCWWWQPLVSIFMSPLPPLSLSLPLSFFSFEQLMSKPYITFHICTVAENSEECVRVVPLRQQAVVVSCSQ